MAEGRTFDGSLHLAQGEDNVGGYVVGGALNLALKGGDCLNARMSENGTELIMTAASGPNTVRKTGNGYVRITSLPKNVERFEITGGGVTYAPKGGRTEVAADSAAITVTIPNAGFEECTEGSGYLNIYGNSAHGWSGSSTDGNSANVVFRRNNPEDYGWMCNYVAPEGNWVLGINGNGVASTTVTVPVAGEYDFSMMTCQRHMWGGGLFEVVLEKNGTTYPVAGFEPHYAATWSDWQGELAASDGEHLNGYLFSRYRTPYLQAGDYRLSIQARLVGGLTATIDDLKMTLASSVTPDTVVKVPNGDFERLNSATYNCDKIPYLCLSNHPEGWTLNQNGNAIGREDNNCFPDVGLSMPSTLRAWNPSLHIYGAHCLVFFENGGSATTADFTVPAGTYKLRHKMAGYPCPDNLISGTSLTAGQSYNASVKIGADEPIALGAASGAAMNRWLTFTYGTEFTVPADTPIAVTIAATTANGSGFIDDVELVRQDVYVPPTPPVNAKNLIVSVAEGAKLTLDFQGAARVSKLVLGDEEVIDGIISAATHPDYISGTGSLEVVPARGMVFGIR